MTRFSKTSHLSIGLLCASAIVLWLAQLPYPSWPALAAVVFISLLLVRRPSAWLVLVPALWPIIDLVPITGRMYFAESDALAALCIAVLSFRHIRNNSPSQTTSRPSPHSVIAPILLGGIAVSYALSSLQALIPFPPLNDNAFVGYDSPFNALRLAKGILWPLLLLPHWNHEQHRLGSIEALRLFRIGMTAGFATASLAALWERLAFLQLLDFATDYRTTALFWEMNVGGAAFDGWLMLTLPFVVQGLLEARRSFAILCHVAVLTVGAYAVLTTFSRGVYLGVAVMLMVAVFAWWQAGHHARKAVPDGTRHRHLIAPAILVVATFVAIAVFHGGGYRGLATFLASGIAVYLAGEWIRPITARQWLPLLIAALPLWLISYLLHDLFDKAAYGFFATALTAVTVTGLRAWQRPDYAPNIKLLTIATLWCAGGPGWINLHWGGEAALPGGIAASCLLLAALFGQTRFTHPIWTLSRDKIVSTALCSLAVAMIAVGAGSYFIGYRFASTTEDTTGRWLHWRNGVSLLQNATEWAIGIGPGRYAYRYSLLVPSNQYPGAWRIGHEKTPTQGDGENSYLRLLGPQHPNARQLLRITQNIGLEHSGPFTIKLRARAEKQTRLHIEVCQKHLLYPGDCVADGDVPVPAGNRWTTIERHLSNQPFADHGNWFAPRIVTFAIAITNPGQAVDIDDLVLIDNRERNLLSNGNLAEGADRWFFTSDRVHLPYHAKSIFAHLLIEQGLFGLLTVGIVTLIALLRLARIRYGNTDGTVPILAALAGFLAVGLFDSLLDVPRLSVFFYGLLGISLTLQRRNIPVTNREQSATVPPPPESVAAKTSLLRSPKHLLLMVALLATAALASGWAAFRQSGYTPQEVIDHAERYAADKPRLKGLATPALGQLRGWLNLPSPKERLSRPFLVPPPPPLTRTNADQNVPPTTEGRILRVGKNGAIQTIAEAARLARDGDIVEIEAGEYHGDVALWHQKKLTIRGVGGSARLFADGTSSEGKAIWVIRNGDFTIENIDFIGARVPDRNGAGIRFENGALKIRNCLFWNNQNGILTTGSDAQRDARLEIEGSEFGYNGAGDGLSHNLYVGKIALLRVTGSYFHHANVGHLLKSRAARNEILYNRLTDENGGRSSYELDLPNGGFATIMGNIIQQSHETENSTMISYGREGYAWPKNSLDLANNTIVNDQPNGGAFLRTGEGTATVTSMNNLLVGRGKYHVQTDLVSANDIETDWEIFRQASRYDYRLAEKGLQLNYKSSGQNTNDNGKLMPDKQYWHPRQVLTLNNNPNHPGALQTTDAP